MVMTAIIIQEVKGLMKSLYCPGGRYAIFHSGSLFTLFYMVMGCIKIQEVKGLTEKFLPSRRKSTWLWLAL